MPGSATCWGELDGQDLESHAQWQVFFPSGTTKPFMSGTADAGGNVAVFLNLPCGQGSTSAYAIDTTDNISDTADSPPGC